MIDPSEDNTVLPLHCEMIPHTQFEWVIGLFARWPWNGSMANAYGSSQSKSLHFDPISVYLY